MSIPIFSQTNNNGNINSNCFETQYQWQWQYQFLFKPISMAIPIAIVVPRQYQWQYQYQLFSSAISMSMAISIVSIALSQYQCSINQYLSKLININGNVNCSKNTLSIVNGNNNTSKIVNTNGCQYYCSCLLCTKVDHPFWAFFDPPLPPRCNSTIMAIPPLLNVVASWQPPPPD